MILNCIVGDQSRVDLQWENTTDKYGLNFIVNPSINQRIRLAKNINSKLKKVKSSSNMSVYSIVENDEFENDIPVVIHNSYINMNLSASRIYNDDISKIDNLLYITLINNNYRLISYNIENENCEIVQTYKKTVNREKFENGETVFQGCVLKFKNFTDGDFDKLISLTVFDIKMNRYKKIIIDVDMNYNVNMTTTQLTPREMKIIKDRLKKYGKNKFFHFFMSAKTIPTSVILFDNTDGVCLDSINIEAKKLSFDPVLLSVPGNQAFTEDDEEMKKSIDRLFTKHIMENNVRAITTCGIKIPFDFYRKYKLLYVFEFNPMTNVTKCIKCI